MRSWPSASVSRSSSSPAAISRTSKATSRWRRSIGATCWSPRASATTYERTSSGSHDCPAAMSAIDLDRYFARIGYDGPRAPTRQVLERLHAQHVERIPFENLSPFLGEPVRLDPASLEAKLVATRRR